MSACIVLSDGRTWFAANWAYDAAIRYIAFELPETPEGGELKNWLVLQTCEECGPGVGSVDLRELSPDDCMRFEQATHRAVVTSREIGPVGWHEPSFFEPWHELLCDLAELIEESHTPPPSFVPRGESP